MSIKISTLSMKTMNLNASRDIEEKYVKANKRISELNDEQNINVISYGTKLKDQILKRRDLFFSESFLSRNKNIQSDFDKMLISVESIIDNVGKFSDSIVQFSTGFNDIEQDNINTLKEDAKAVLSSLITALNAKNGDKYLFGGKVDDIPPVNRSVTDFFNGDAGVENFDYYVGGNDDIKIRISDDKEISYKINAGDKAFEKAFRGLDLFINSELVSSDEIVSVQKLLGDALDGMLDIKSYIGVKDAEIINTNDFLITVQESAKNFLADEFNAAEQAANLINTQSLMDKLMISTEMNNMLRKAIAKMVG